MKRCEQKNCSIDELFCVCHCVEYTYFLFYFVYMLQSPYSLSNWIQNFEPNSKLSDSTENIRGHMV